MNISTGGPHILLFERDQQLASLLVSELQLAGYESHTARTAVEVFDAIARHPIRLVLVNLAQAAAARREFWVALDTQRRGRGVQVLTFHCTNIAGYGPHDPDDRSQSAIADMEIDGMAGIMSLVDAVRSRIPGVGVVSNTASTTVPRMSRVVTPLPPTISPSYTTSVAQRPAYAAPSVPPSPAPRANVAPPPSGAIPPSAPQPMAGAANQQQPDRIRAVLYPNQRTWATQNSPAYTTSENRSPYETQPAQPMPNPPPAESSVLQRLASGQTGPNGSESGLAQLSRMVRERQTPPVDTLYTGSGTYTLTESGQVQEPPPVSYAAPVAPPPPPTMPVAPPAQVPMQPTSTMSQANYFQAPATAPAVPLPPSPNVGPANYTQAPAQPAQPGGSFSNQPLRASPIQDLPVERATGGNTGSEVSRRPDVLSRTNYGPQTSAVPAAPAPANPPPLEKPATPTYSAPSAPSSPPPPPPPKAAPPTPHQVHTVENNREDLIAQLADTFINDEKTNGKRTSYTESASQDIDSDSASIANNAILLDIMQSLPPMPPPPPQPPQPVVLTGRATRSLGSVLLEGHLVPESRLEVAQNVQRMLRGVDLNYQLGEILLMFKLLTPDQLLAASLVSYGLITATQISALGRIRQELHAIGLEYDLENLLIMFRILTPEQLREAKNSWQG